jgi:hypothetical protein
MAKRLRPRGHETAIYAQSKVEYGVRYSQQRPHICNILISSHVSALSLSLSLSGAALGNVSTWVGGQRRGGGGGRNCGDDKSCATPSVRLCLCLCLLCQCPRATVGNTGGAGVATCLLGGRAIRRDTRAPRRYYSTTRRVRYTYSSACIHTHARHRHAHTDKHGGRARWDFLCVRWAGAPAGSNEVGRALPVPDGGW